MRVRKAEREAMVTLLERDHEDVESVATQALLLAWQHMVQREWWCVVFVQERVWTTVHGPFESKNMAEKFTGTLTGSGPNCVALVLRMTGSEFDDGNPTLEAA